MDPPCGAFAPVPTPVEAGGSFDEDALAAHLAWLAEEKLDGALILGTNGEFPSFTLRERRQIAVAAASATDGTGLRLLLNVGSCALGEANGATKNAVFWDNGAKLYGLDREEALGAVSQDNIESIRAEYRASGVQRSNRAYGYVHAG